MCTAVLTGGALVLADVSRSLSAYVMYMTVCYSESLQVTHTHVSISYISLLLDDNKTNIHHSEYIYTVY